ncbi:MAG: alpha-2-macroglobulin family protein, partial [Bacteroidota bacterium]
MTNGTKFKQGTYLLTLTAKDPFGQIVETRNYFTVFDPVSREVPEQTFNWFVPLNVRGEPGEKARFLIGSSEKDVPVMVEIRMHDSLVSRYWMTLDNNQSMVEVPIKEEYRGNFLVNFCFVKHNRSFQNSQIITVPYTNKKLDIAFESFRDKLLPGQKEEWKIRITDASKKGVSAEFLATMYDASLDAFQPHSWNFSLYPTYFISPPWYVNLAFGISRGMGFKTIRIPDNNMIRNHQYEQLNWFGFNYYGRSGIFKRGAVMMDKAPLQAMDMTAESSNSVDTKTVTEDENPASAGQSKSPEKQSSPFSGYPVRKDFRETAFFYPVVVTDSSGILSLKFDVPESLTKWKFMGFGLTKNLSYGQVEKELVTRKELMIFSNSPRFVREGDTLVFSAKIVNLSDRALSGDVILEMFDALTQKPVMVILANNEQRTANNAVQTEFFIPLGESASFSWKIAIPVDPALSLLQYRIVARSGNFSDGEENIFPVLTNRILVTESLPLPVRGKGSFDFSFEKLLKSKTSSTLKNYNLTLEFTSNPVWYAIQALPVLDEPKYPSADNIFNSFYANSIASMIVNSNPSIKRVFENWKTTTPDALLSNLEKNQDLKSALLRETPWVLEAKSESERK